MVRLREIPRTAAFAWSTDISKPFLATGTRAGAVDADFSSETKLEIWQLESGGAEDTDAKPVGSINTESRFYDLAWSPPTADKAGGIIAGALESGALNLWDASLLKKSSEHALLSSTSKHSGAVKSVQFNPHRTELLASSGAKGELFITDLNNASNPYRLGTAAARADDFDALDWNKVVPHIMATAGNGGFVTVWDVKAKKESLTLNNYNRKPASAVAWNPALPTKLATASPSDQDPLILMWDLRNSSAPEQVLKGHDQGILSLSWCVQDNSLLLSCGKDNRTICWNPLTGAIIGEFPIVTNWTFQTRWSPRHPSMLAIASFDGKISIQSVQNTNPSAKPATTNQAANGEDFFANVQTQPQTSSFSLPNPPKWLKRPVGATFGFGGKIVRFEPLEDQSNKSKVQIQPVTGDEAVSKSIGDLQTALKEEDMARLCEEKAAAATTAESKNDWKVIGSLVSESPRSGLLVFLGFSKTKETTEVEEPSKEVNDTPAAEKQVNGTATAAKSNRLSSFFDNTGDNQNFLADLASSKGAKTNNPFQIYTGSESDVDRKITRALTLGDFEEALDICLEEKRMSDAFMIAICGDQKCIDKAQTAYFAQQSQGPNYLRLLASVVGKDLWDVVYNADLSNWEEVMAALCTYADQSEFPDLCEALGDRLEESKDARKDAAFCYLAGSKLEKVLPIWIREMCEAEIERSSAASDESAYAIHVSALQTFIEKVTVFRKATKYEDAEALDVGSEWKLGTLYELYSEYADIVATFGFLDLADHYLSLLPSKFSTAQVARDRVSRATKKAAKVPISKATTRGAGLSTAFAPSTNMQPAIPSASPGAPSSNASRYGAPGYPQPYQASSTSYGPTGAFTYGSPAPAQNLHPGPPPPAGPPTISGVPKGTASGGNWNDLPEGFNSKPTSRRGTPGPGSRPVIAPPFATQAPNGPPQPTTSPPMMQRAASPMAPPPRPGAPRVGSPVINQLASPIEQSHFSPSTAASSYAPSQPQQYNAPPQVRASLPARTQSPYNAPPSGAPSSNRYAPAPGVQQQSYPASQYGPVMGQTPPPQAQMPPSRPPVGPPPMGGPPAMGGPPPMGGPPGSRPGTAQSQRTGTPATSKYPAGDRTHMLPDAMPIYDVLSKEMQRIQVQAPAKFKDQVEDTAKRLNLLFDVLNNGEVASSGVALLQKFTRDVQSRDFDAALAVHGELAKQVENGSSWLVGLKRFLSMSKVTPV